MCFISNGKCEAHYDVCANANQDTCNSNIPKDTSKKCKWDTSCIETDRLCEDLIDYNDIHIRNSEYSLKGCFELKAEADKVCIDLPKEGCKQYYASCDKADGKENLCGTFKPVNDDKNGFKSLYYCSYSTTDSKFTETKKKCENFVKGEDDSNTCLLLDASNENKMCYYDSEKNECPEIYITCDSYNLVKTDSTQRSDSECAAITYRDSTSKVENPHYECYLNEAKTCTNRKKACDAIKDSQTCNSHVLDDEDKQCLFTGSKCKEIYKTCEKYEEKVKENKKKEDCEIIAPFEESGKTYKCVFGQNSACTKKELACEDYKGQDALECKAYSEYLDGDDHQCALIGGKCIEQFNACEKYEEKNKTICESIALYDSPNYKCILYHDKVCKTEQKLCSEYLGDSEIECKKYKASVDTKKCVLENHKCVEKSILNYCSDYRGTNKEECESIKPFRTDVDSVDPSSKCVYTIEGCIKQSKGCGDATTESECLAIVLENTKKQCVYIGNSCTEQYKTCLLYYDNENTIDKTICESILIQETGYPSAEYRCEYAAPATGQTKGTCTRKKRSCSDFEPKLIQRECGSISLTDITKKCVFNNNSCSPHYKTCSELSTLLSATDDLCKNGVTSSADKSCVAKSDKSGCEEKEKEKEQEQEQEQGQEQHNEKDEKPKGSTAENPESQPNEAEPTDGNSFASKNYLSILTFIAVCLIF